MSPRYAEGNLVTAVGVWADFPVDAVPRPYVLTQSAVIEAGYRTGEAKGAFFEGRVRFAEGLPAAAAAALVAGGVRLSPDSRSLLLVTNAIQVRHPFRTDRGERMLPAWSLDVQDWLGPVIVLDDEPGNSWHPVTYPYARHWYSQDTATVDDHGTDLTYRFWGSPEIDTDYADAQILQTATAVAIAPRAVGRRAVDRAGMVAPLLHVQIRTVTVRLDQPLGQRVLVNANGLAVDAAFQR